MSDLDLIYGTKPKAPPPQKVTLPTVKPDTPDRPENPPVAPSTPPSSPAKGKRSRTGVRVRSTNQSTSQSASQSTSQLVSRPDNRIVDRPKAFYITERLDEKLDKAVDYLQRKHGIKKVDRSTIVNALLDHDSLWTEQALDQLVERVVSQLTSRLISR